jgi:predicted flavoprotein YhiN
MTSRVPSGTAIVETTPALVPLVLDDSRHAQLSGIAHSATVTVRSVGAVAGCF